MGYSGVYGTFRTYKEAFDVVVRTELNSIKFLSVRIVGSVAYCACESKEGVKFLLVILMSKSKHDFMYKAMDETSGPCYYNFTQKQLDLVKSYKPLNKYAADFREKVQAEINKKKAEKAALRKAKVIYVMGRKANVIEEKEYNGEKYLIVKWTRVTDGFIVINKYGDPATSHRYHSAERAWEAFLEGLRR